MNFEDHLSAVVTGAASGLGAAVAKKLGQNGVKVAILDRDNEAGSVMAGEVGGIYVECDVSNPDNVSSALETARSRHGQERICVNCAGIAMTKSVLSGDQPHDPELFERIVRVNLLGTFNMASQSAAGMAKTESINTDGERGVIINTTSIAALDGPMGYTAYCASKAGVAGMTLPMARDLASKGIRVLAIAPGMFDTPMASQIPADVKSKVEESIPFPQRTGEPAEFAALVVHCIENRMLNGEVIRIDGAWRMPPR